MKFKDLREKMGNMSGMKLTGQEVSTYYRQNPGAKRAAKNKLMKKAIEFALDHGGAYSYSVKEIEKMKKGLSKHPEVKKALMFANEETDPFNEGMDLKKIKSKYKRQISDFQKGKKLDPKAEEEIVNWAFANDVLRSGSPDDLEDFFKDIVANSKEWNRLK